MTMARLATTVRTATVVGIFGLVGLLLSGCGASGTSTPTTNGSPTAPTAPTTPTGPTTPAAPTTPNGSPTTTSPPAVPTTVVKALFLGQGVGIVTETSPSSGGCSQLLATTDFTHWRNISPPQQSGTDGSCPDIWQSASFVSPLEGWVLGVNGGDVNTVLYRTDNGGTTWVEVTGGSQGSAGGTQVIGFTSAQDGWRQQFATGSNAFYLLETTGDGGESWTGIPQFSTNGGCEFAVDVFANPLDGFAGNNLAPGATSSLGAPPPQAFLWETADGGRSWHEATVPAPPGTTHATAFYGLPTFFSPTSGILPVEYVQNGKDGAGGAAGAAGEAGAGGAAGRDTLDFYATANSGSTWTLVSTAKTAGAVPAETGPAACFSSANYQSSFPAVAIASPTTWWVLSSGTHGTTVDVTSNGGSSWTDVSATGLGPAGVLDPGGVAQTTGEDLTLVGATGSKVAWAGVVNESDESAPLTLQTSDGGRTWSPLENLALEPGQPTPTASASSPSCTNEQLTTRAGRSGVAMGNVGQTFVFTNVSTSACTLYGYPGVAGLDGVGRQIVQATRTPNGYIGGLSSSDAPAPIVALAPGQAASALVEGDDNQFGSMPCVQLSGLLVTAPNTTRSVDLPGAFSDCDGLQIHPVVPGTSGTEES
jgi:Protein of unknown function (DUF4232)